MDTASGAPKTGGPPSALACQECRRKHVKCSGDLPQCARCLRHRLRCDYIPSRRGRVPRTKNGHATTRSTPPTTTTTTAAPPPASDPVMGAFSAFTPLSLTGSESGITEKLPARQRSAGSTSDVDAYAASNMAAYYSRFHRLHPILLPEGSPGIEAYGRPLKLVMQMIGSQYVMPHLSDRLFPLATQELRTAPASLESVQACLLLAIICHARTMMNESMHYLRTAFDHAAAIGLGRRDSDKLWSLDVFDAESARRTLFELWSVDIYCAALSQRLTAANLASIMDTPLPCSEDAYTVYLTASQPLTLAQYDMRFFQIEDHVHSSYTFRIDATRILAHSATVFTSQRASLEEVQVVDTAIASWFLHLPEDRACVIDQRGEIDQLLLQAHMVVHLASILLHLPRSGLPFTNDVPCATEMAKAGYTSRQSAMKALAASKEILALATLPVQDYTPLAICCFVFACMVQLSAAHEDPNGPSNQHRDRVTLAMGLLKSLGKRWALAKHVMECLAPVANSIFHTPPKDIRAEAEVNSESSPNSAANDSGFDPGALAPFSLENVDWSTCESRERKV